MADTVHLANGQGQRLGNVIAKGGEGAVCSLQDPTLHHLVVKVYDAPKLSGPDAPRLRRKVELMCGLPIRDNPNLCWPRQPVYDAQGTWLGYVMYRAGGVAIENFCHPMKVKRIAADWDRAEACSLALKFVDAVSVLHKAGILVGDINTGNVMFDRGSGKLWLIDCDSCQIAVGAERFLCPVGIGAFTAPELQGMEFSQSPRTEAAERFSVAIMIYKILMLGSHPFSFCGGYQSASGSEVADEAANIRAGNCPLGKGTGLKLPKGLWFNRWSHLPFQVKNAFVETFRSGHSDPSKRMSLQQWRGVLKHYESCLARGYHSADFYPIDSKPRAATEAWEQKTA